MTTDLGVLLDETARLAKQYLKELDRLPAGATATLEELRQKLARPLAEEGLDARQIIRELTADVSGGINGSAGGRFFGWVIGSSLPAALAADWMVSAWDQNAGAYTCAPAAGVVEEIAGEWLKELLGLPRESSFALVGGCQTAHTTCLTVARYALLHARGWDLHTKGMFGASPIRIYTSTEMHGSFLRAAKLVGFGTDQFTTLPADKQGVLRPDVLREALAQNRNEPAFVLLQAGDLNIGAFDPFAELIPIAHHAGAWVHIDGAFGLWLAPHPRLRTLLEGAELADSWATDGHKWLNVPYDCGYAFVRDAKAHRAAFASHASYLTKEGDARDAVDWNPEWSRRARGFATYAAIRELGRSGVVDLVDRCCRHAHSLVTRIGTLDGAEVLWEPTINQGLVGFRADADEVMRAIATTGEAFFTPTTWRGQRAMRVSVCSWRTTEADVDRAVEAVRGVLANY